MVILHDDMDSKWAIREPPHRKRKSLQNFKTKKLAHKVCAKNIKNHAKMAKIAQKRPKPFNKTREKIRKKTALTN